MALLEEALALADDDEWAPDAALVAVDVDLVVGLVVAGVYLAADLTAAPHVAELLDELLWRRGVAEEVALNEYLGALVAQDLVGVLRLDYAHELECALDLVRVGARGYAAVRLRFLTSPQFAPSGVSFGQSRPQCVL